MSKEKRPKLTQVQRQRRVYQWIVIVISVLVIASMLFSAIAKY